MHTRGHRESVWDGPRNHSEVPHASSCSQWPFPFLLFFFFFLSFGFNSGVPDRVGEGEGVRAAKAALLGPTLLGERRAGE